MTLETKLETQGTPDTKVEPKTTPEWVIPPAQTPEKPLIINPKRPDKDPRVASPADPETWGGK